MTATSLPIRRLALVEDDAPFRSALTRLISEQPGWSCVASSGNAEDALSVLPPAEPDLVLIDIRLPNRTGRVGSAGLDLIPQLKALLPNTKLVILTVVQETDDILRAIQTGAAGYILKGDTIDELADQIQTIFDGGAYMSPAIARKLNEWFHSHQPAQPDAGFGLTEREWEILGLTARGHSQAQIAHGLGISRNTVRNHWQNIYSKFRLNSAAAVIYKVAPILKVREALRDRRPDGTSKGSL